MFFGDNLFTVDRGDLTYTSVKVSLPKAPLKKTNHTLHSKRQKLACLLVLFRETFSGGSAKDKSTINSSESFAVKYVGSCGQFSFLFQMLMSVLKIISLFYSKLSRSDPYYFIIFAPLFEHTNRPCSNGKTAVNFFRLFHFQKIDVTLPNGASSLLSKTSMFQEGRNF